MKVRLLKPWNMTDAGAVLDLDRPVAVLLIGRGLATDMGNVDGAVSVAKNVVAPPVDKAIRKVAKRKGSGE